VESTHLAERFLANPLYKEIVERLRGARSLSVRDRVELQRDVTSLNVLGHLLSRTRKREVQVNQPIRRAQVVPVSPDPIEVEFYERVTELCRTAYIESHGDLVAAFAATMPQRQMASSMVAMVDYVAERLRKEELEQEEEVVELTDMEPAESEASNDEPARSRIQWRELGDFQEWRRKLAAVDTKWEAFADAVRKLEADEPQAKIVVFAFFKRTLRYLEDRLGEISVECARLDGDVKSVPDDPEADERGKLLARFRTDPKMRVLLSSEVGDEGVDLQFARVLINYDLPWNPMKVEQRIGRIDRIGQKHPVKIFNFSTLG
jgi:SNF2 family DNA or RNA helicase